MDGHWGAGGEGHIALLSRAFAGINFFDTADTYAEGYGEEILVKALGGHRRDMVIGTKFGYDFYSNETRRPQRTTPTSRPNLSGTPASRACVA